MRSGGLRRIVGAIARNGVINMPAAVSHLPAISNGVGYASREYAESLSEFGDVCALPNCGGWLLATPIPRTELRDALGCYPLFSCGDWTALGDDLAALATRLVSVRLVTDSFAEVTAVDLAAAFPDVCYEYKQHFVTDLARPLEQFVDRHHQRNARKALRAVEVGNATIDAGLLGEWCGLYQHLVERHGITGIQRFSPASFAKQLGVPGLLAFAAREGSETCGMTLWYVRGDVAYYHLAAYNERGYELRASFALFWHALTQFAKLGIRWAALGAGAGTQASDSGLTRFKRGWATGTRPVYFCGRILQPRAYAELVGRSQNVQGYFPAYRHS